MFNGFTTVPRLSCTIDTVAANWVCGVGSGALSGGVKTDFDWPGPPSRAPARLSRSADRSVLDIQRPNYSACAFGHHGAAENWVCGVG